MKSIFELIMLVCFGFSWPFAILKTLRVKNPAGKSYLFMTLIILGYIAGCVHKIRTNMDWVFWLYILNTLLVLTDMVLCLYYANQIKKGKLPK